MHESSVASEIAEIVLEVCHENNISKVTRILLEVGEFSCIYKDHLVFAFNILSRDTVMDGASLEMEVVKATAYCHNCQTTFPITFTEKKCPKCHCMGIFSENSYITSVKSIVGE